MALSTRAFWKAYYAAHGSDAKGEEGQRVAGEGDNVERGVEWYYGDDRALQWLLQQTTLRSESGAGVQVVLHLGCGAASLSWKLARAFGKEEGMDEPVVVINADFAEQCVQESAAFAQRGATEGKEEGAEKEGAPGTAVEFAVMDAMRIPVRTGTVDAIVEKGLFDSLTMDSAVQQRNAQAYLDEVCRVLRPRGTLYIFSIFEPCGPDKDVMGLLSHPDLAVQCDTLQISPYEVPDQPHCFVYELTAP